MIYKKNRVIYHYEEKRVTILQFFMLILSNKVMQKYRKITLKNIFLLSYDDAVVTENV